jgi:catechol-2,3-dioxygenase
MNPTPSITNPPVIHPTLHHFGLTTGNLQGMKDWYATVLGMVPTHETAAPDGATALPPMQASWVTNDGANHRIAIMALPGLTADPERARHPRLQHVAFEYPTIDDLLATYARLKSLGIEPVLTADHGVATAFYYEDPTAIAWNSPSITSATGRNPAKICAPRPSLRQTRWALTSIPTK